MTFQTDTNVKRVKKMQDTLLLIVKSAKRNKASREDVRQMLEPLAAMMLRIGAVDQPAVTAVTDEVPKGQTGLHTPPWASVKDMAEQADLKDLTRALAVYLNRIDEELLNDQT